LGSFENCPVIGSQHLSTCSPKDRNIQFPKYVLSGYETLDRIQKFNNPRLIRIDQIAKNIWLSVPRIDNTAFILHLNTIPHRQ
jgi:hypothetical protein